jgi:hypothetical protein
VLALLQQLYTFRRPRGRRSGESHTYKLAMHFPASRPKRFSQPYVFVSIEPDGTRELATYAHESIHRFVSSARGLHRYFLPFIYSSKQLLDTLQGNLKPTQTFWTKPTQTITPKSLGLFLWKTPKPDKFDYF